MKNKFVKIIAFILSVACCFGMVGCKKDGRVDPSDPGISSDPGLTSDPNHSTVVADSDNRLFEKGESDYKIVVPSVRDRYISEAVEELNYFLSLSVGSTLEVIEDDGLSFSENDRYVSLGKTTVFAQSGIVVDEMKYVDGFEIVSKGKSVFIVGQGTSGVLYGVYKFLYHEIGFELFSDDEIEYRESDTVKLFDYDVREVPDFDVRHIGVAEFYRNEAGVKAAHRLGAHGYEDYMLSIDGVTAHTSIAIAPPEKYFEEHYDWYSNDLVQLCYTRDVEGLSAVVIAKLKEELVSQPGAKIAAITHTDGNAWCTCASCSECKTKYGAESAAQLLFINVVAKELNRWLAAPSGDPNGSYTDDYKEEYGVDGGTDRKIYVMMFAYTRTQSPPSFIDVELEPNVAIQWAPISANYNYALDHAKNASFKSTLDGWRKIVNNILYWGYSMHENMFYPVNALNALQDNYKFMKSAGTIGIFQESNHPFFSVPDWEILEGYVQAKLLWNINSNVKELVDNFMAHYYGPAAQTVKEIFYDEQDYLIYLADVLNSSGRQTDDAAGGSEYWSQSVCLNYIERFENAKKDLDELRKTDYLSAEKFSDRITVESLVFRYLLLKNYKTLYSQSVFAEMKADFIAEVNRTGAATGVYAARQQAVKALLESL